jgi:hypothetical protein
VTARAAKRRRPGSHKPTPDERFGRFCIGCGCCDSIGCGVGCSWLATDPTGRVGVCSAYRALLVYVTLAMAKAIHREQAAKAEEML